MKDIYANSPELYEKVSEDENKVYYYLPHTQEYIGVPKPKIWCDSCNKAIPDAAVTFDLIKNKMTHETEGHRVHNVYIRRGPACHAKACPLCGKEILKETDESYGYCSPEHRVLGVQRLIRAATKEDKK